MVDLKTHSIGVAQIDNTSEIERNFASIMSLLEKFEQTAVNLVLFPECSLSGFTSRMNECTRDVLKQYIDKLQTWVQLSGIEVVLPTAVSESGKVYNSGFWIKPDAVTQFFKVGLTDSEQKFFSAPEAKTPKVFEVEGVRFAVLICYEAELAPWFFFQKSEVDVILWPGYWGWTKEEEWSAKRGPGRTNPIFSNMKEWKCPLVQANFAKNNLAGHTGLGPEGLSFVVNSNNQLFYRGPHLEEAGYIVNLVKSADGTIVESIQPLAK